jgi:hypothetical protein
MLFLAEPEDVAGDWQAEHSSLCLLGWVHRDP